MVGRNNEIIKKLVLDAKREYDKDAEHRVHVFYPDTYDFFAVIIDVISVLDRNGCWKWNGARQKRPMSSIVLQPGVKDMLLADCHDFLSSEDWLACPSSRFIILTSSRCAGMPSEVGDFLSCWTIDVETMSTSGIPFRRGYLLHGVPGRFVAAF